jgi:hypothetical protein
VRTGLGGRKVRVAVVRRRNADIAANELLRSCTGNLPHVALPRFVPFMDAMRGSRAQRVLEQGLKAAGPAAPGASGTEGVGYVVQP